MFKIVLLVAAFFPALASAKVVDQGEVVVESKLSYIKLSVQAKCRPPQYEDDSFTVYYSKESFDELSQYRSYSTKLIGRTCGEANSTTELSATDFETVEVLLYNYGTAKKSFDTQISNLVDSL